MNRAFVNEDADSGVVLVPPRAPLPSGIVNYVTPRGFKLLKDEMAELEAEKTRLQNARKMADQEKVRLLTVARGRRADLKARIAGAKVVEPGSQPRGEVRFGASVKLRAVPIGAEADRHISIVGVDEANAAEGRISFIAPVARMLTGKKTGDLLQMPSRSGPESFEIVEISYQAD